MHISNEELVKQAESIVKPHKTFQDRLLGDVGAALVRTKGMFTVEFVLIQELVQDFALKQVP